MILNYLHSDSTIIAKMKVLYRKTNHLDKKSKHVEFNIIDKIQFFSLSMFKYGDTFLQPFELGIDQKLIDSSKLYREKFYFEPFESPFLKKISYPNNSHLFLTFSKPVENYVIVELCNIKNYPNSIRRFGLAMSILFIFDSTGFIQKTLVQAAANN